MTLTDFAMLTVGDPDGSKVFLAGTSYPDYYATIAYSGVTGTRLWRSYYPAGSPTVSIAKSVSVIPDGSEVIVTGYSVGYGTVAYAA